MTKEEKELLLQDLCARLPYRVQYKNAQGYKEIINIWSPGFHTALNTILYDEKPSLYLRPMSSMTEDELNDCVQQSGIRDIICPDWYSLPKEKHFEARLKHSMNMFLVDSRTIDWLNKKMFDYRGLIEKGLALEAPEGMYVIK